MWRVDHCNVWRSDATPAAAYLILSPGGVDDHHGNNDDNDDNDDGDGDDGEGTSDCVKMLTVSEGGAGLEVAGWGEHTGCQCQGSDIRQIKFLAPSWILFTLCPIYINIRAKAAPATPSRQFVWGTFWQFWFDYIENSGHHSFGPRQSFKRRLFEGFTRFHNHGKIIIRDGWIG